MTNGSTAALDAIGNPTRRAVLELLGTGESSVAELTQRLPVTQSAISQHLRVLREAGLVKVTERGRRHLYSVDLDGLGEVRAWVDRFWDDVLGSFAEHVAASADEPPPDAVVPSRAEEE